MSAHGSRRVVLLALAANTGIAVAKFVAFFMTASASMLAEAIHSMADTGNQLLLLFGLRRASKPPDDRHPFGYKMESYFWSFVVAIMLFSLGGLFALYEGYHKHHEVHAALAAGRSVTIDHPTVALGVLLVSMFLEGSSWLAATREINRHRGKESLLAFIESSKSTEIIVIWMEDTGALIGLTLALCGIVLSLVTGNPLWDVYATFGIGVLLVFIAFFVARETKSLLIGEAASNESQEQIRTLVRETPGVVRLMHLRTMQLGEDEFLAAIKIEWEPSLTANEISDRTNALEARIRKGNPLARYLFVETDVFDPERYPDSVIDAEASR